MFEICTGAQPWSHYMSMMIASQTPPNKVRHKPSRPGGANGKQLLSPNLTLPMDADPAEESELTAGSSRGKGETFANRDAGRPPKTRLHPRFRNSNEDERDSAGVARAPAVIGGDVVRCGENSRFAQPRQQSLAPRPTAWSSWNAAFAGASAGGSPWRLQFRTDSDDVATVSQSVASVTRLHAAQYVARSRDPINNGLRSAAGMPVDEYQRMLLHHSHRPSHQRLSYARPATAHARSSVVQRNYSSWQHLSEHSSLDLGSRNFVQQSRALTAPSQIHTTMRCQSSPLHELPKYTHHHSGLAGCSPLKVAAAPSQGTSTNMHRLPSGNSQGFASKRFLSPTQQQQMTPLFKKAKGFDKLDLLCSATLEIGELHDNPTGCSCPKSKCVALYCDCFKAGRRCNPTQCSCLQCKNTIAESGVNGARTKAIRSILARNPRAFRTAGEGNPLLKLPPGEIACNCIRSRCLKLYCTCFQRNLACRPGICTCVGCYNTESDREGHRKAAIEQILEKRPDAFQMKVKETGLGCACKNNRCIKKYCCCFQTQLACTDKCTCRQCENKRG